MSGRYASYWNAFLFHRCLSRIMFIGVGVSIHPGVASGWYASSWNVFFLITDFVIQQVNRSQNGLQPQIDLERRHDRSVETDAQPKRVLNSLRI